jgi:hypothetical protein
MAHGGPKQVSSETTSDKNVYEVGYGKPPKSGQFRKGQSGNVAGSSAARRQAKSTFGNPFQEKLNSNVEVPENGKTVRRTRKHMGVRRLVEAAAKGDMHALREMLELQKASDPSPSVDDYFRMDLLTSLAWGPPEVLLHQPDTIVKRDLPPGDTAKELAVPKNTRRKRKRSDEPRDQTWKSLVLFELERKVSVTGHATGDRRTMAMRDVILEQLATAFANGRKGAMKLAVRLNEMVVRRQRKMIPVVYIPHDYVIPPKCDDSRGWPRGHEHHESWRPFYPMPKPSSGEGSEA